MSLHGEFDLISPPALLQCLGQERRSARLAARCGDSVALIELQEGLVVAARCDELRGEEAVFRFVAWTSGRFKVAHLPAEEARADMAASCEELLLEAARRWDEEGRR